MCIGKEIALWVSGCAQLKKGMILAMEVHEGEALARRMNPQSCESLLQSESVGPLLQPLVFPLSHFS